MRILASQTAVALQNSALFTKSVSLLAHSEARNAELLATQRELGAAQRHQVLNSERHRIARELHDSVAQTVLSAMRWRLTARQLGQTIPLTRAIGEYYLAQVVNQSLPGGVVGDAGRAVRARHQAGLRRAGAAVAIERLAGQVALFLVLAPQIARLIAPNFDAAQMEVLTDLLRI